MKIGHFLFIALIFLSTGCRQSSNYNQEVPVYKLSGVEDLEQFEFVRSGKVSALGLVESFKDFGIYSDSLYVVGVFSIKEGDTTSIRPFYLVLFESMESNFNKRLFVTISRTNGHVIDTLSYNHRDWIFKQAYSHSSDLGHDGISLEFLEDVSTQDKPNFLWQIFEVLNSGQIIKAGTAEAFEPTFQRMSSNNPYCGKYTFGNQKIIIEFELRDGRVPNSYSYYLEKTSYKNCRIAYSTFQREIEGNVFIMNDEGDFTIELFDNYALIKKNKWEFCKEMIELNNVLLKE